MPHMTKKKLEILLERCETFQRPKARLEQYIIPSSIAAELLYYAYLKKDIEGKVIYDLGCGTGKLAIGCALLDARKVYGVDIDREALKIAIENSKRLEVDIDWIEEDVSRIKGKGDTVIQNPPFGVRRDKADRVFLKSAIKIGKVIYSMHKAETNGFIRRYVKNLKGRITDSRIVDFELPYSYEFHKKQRKKIKVCIYRIEGG